MKKFGLLLAAALSIFAFTACGKENTNQEVTPTLTEAPSAVPTPTDIPTPTPTAKPEKPTPTPKPTPAVFDIGLAENYKDNFLIGVAVPGNIVNNKNYLDILLKDYNSITCENEMKPDALLDAVYNRNHLDETYTNPAVKFSSCQNAIKFATKNNVKIRLHTLVWHAQTPHWFFTEDYTDNGALVSREVMLLRMENYIKNVLTYFDENYPGLIYAVDVCNEAIDPGQGGENGIRKNDNDWYDVVGWDYYYYAFVYARKYAPDYMKLFYNDYGCSGKVNLMLERLQQAKDEGLIDGIGMQSHLSISDSISAKYMIAVKKFCEAGYELQVTELDIGMDQRNDFNLLKQARKYKVLFSSLKELQEKGYNITSITLWGIDDSHSWRDGEYPLLYDRQGKQKKAYEGAMLSPDIPALDM